jgi:hypothetical protein
MRNFEVTWEKFSVYRMCMSEVNCSQQYNYIHDNEYYQKHYQWEWGFFLLLLGPFYDFTAVIFKPISRSRALPGGVLVQLPALGNLTVFMKNTKGEDRAAAPASYHTSVWYCIAFNLFTFAVVLVVLSEFCWCSSGVGGGVMKYENQCNVVQIA